MKRFLLSTLLFFWALNGMAQTDSTKKDSVKVIRGVFSISDQYKKYLPNYSPKTPNVRTPCLIL